MIESVDELKLLYETTNMSESELQQLINNSGKTCINKVYRRLEGVFSDDKAAILVKLWKKQQIYEIY